ncbi:MULTISPECIES: DUF6950 family protein [unclassified Enterobacter]|uniref:DUF6950 family protein n=1 Tax=unclassified Enterobacter TaxID=2608935 RepID=UPI000F46D557|nr:MULTISPECIES: ornithine carbamoyltransferase [unclassified Enterobacter]
MTVKHNDIIKIIETALGKPHEVGTNDCNIIVMRIIDLIAGTKWSTTLNYKTIRSGIKQLNELGFNSTQDIVHQYCDEVSVTIDGDIWLDDDNPLIMGVVVSGRVLGVNEEHDTFVLINKPKGKYYRTRKI